MITFLPAGIRRVGSTVVVPGSRVLTRFGIGDAGVGCDFSDLHDTKAPVQVGM